MGDAFSKFLELHFFNGCNHNSVVIMDNASIHYHARVRPLINSVGALLVYLLPYSPDLNPIEEAFSAVKAFLMANEGLTTTTNDIQNILITAFGSITHEDCDGWYHDSGYCD